MTQSTIEAQIDEFIERSRALTGKEVRERDAWNTVASRPPRPAGVPPFELYDHRHDPLDRVDHAAEHPDVVQRLASQLVAWRRMAQAARLPPDSRSQEGLGKEELERLRALGYIQ